MGYDRGMATHLSLSERLRVDLDRLASGIGQLLDRAAISKFTNDPDSPVVFITPWPYSWRPLPDAAKPLQLSIRREFAEWDRLFCLLLPRLPPALRRSADEARAYLGLCVDQDDDRSQGVPASIAEARRRLEERVLELSQTLDALAAASPKGILLVADTNALTLCPDPVRYRGVLETQAFTLVIVPTVLAELDQLKVDSRKTPEYRAKAESALRRLKGWRSQGDWLSGVLVDGTITVRAVAAEPEFTALPRHLDPQNADDRILASALEIQREAPGACVVIATSDLNLQNKASMMRLAFLEPPCAPPA